MVSFEAIRIITMPYLDHIRSGFAILDNIAAANVEYRGSKARYGSQVQPAHLDVSKLVVLTVLAGLLSNYTSNVGKNVFEAHYCPLKDWRRCLGRIRLPFWDDEAH